MTNLTRRTVSPVPTLNTLHMMDALLRWEPCPGANIVTSQSTCAPAFDVKDIKDAYVIQADLQVLKKPPSTSH